MHKYLTLILVVFSFPATAMTEEECLAEVLYYEARSENVTGMSAVAGVIMNRVASDRFPDTVCEVVNQTKQFSYKTTIDPSVMVEPEDWNKAYRLAKHILKSGKYFVHNSCHYDVYWSRPYWTKHYKIEFVLGKHVFYTGGC